MSETGQSNGIQKNTPKPYRKKFYLTSLEKTRKALATIFNELYSNKQADTSYYRALGYLLNVMLGYWQLKLNMELEERVEEVERKLEIVYEQKAH